MSSTAPGNLNPPDSIGPGTGRLVQSTEESRPVLGPISDVRVAAIVLAAGMSQRMGSPKPLLPLGDKPMLAHVIDTLRASRAISILIVVTGHAADRLQPILDQPDVISVHNPEYATGEMLSSVKVGLRALPADVDAVLIALCDQPMVREATVSTLVAAWRSRRPRVLLPKFHGKRGHPIVLSAIGFSEIISLPAEATLKAYTSSHASEMIEMEVDDDAVARDIDTPADYAAEQERSTACTKRTRV